MPVPAGLMLIADRSAPSDVNASPMDMALAVPP